MHNNASIIPQDLREPAGGMYSRVQACERMRKTAAAKNVVDCVCNAAIPWPTCNSLAGLHTDASLAPMVQRAAGQVTELRRRLVEQASGVAASYEAEAQALKDVRRMRRELKQTCKAASEFSSLLGGRLSTGCERHAR